MLPSTEVCWDLYLLRFVEKLTLLLLNLIQLLRAQNYGSHQRVKHLVLIFLGIFLFHYFIQYFNPTIELIFNILLIIFLLHFIYTKIKSFNLKVNFNNEIPDISKFNIFIKTLGFTYLNPHVYSDTVFFLGNFSKNLIFNQKILFGVGASIASFVFFFLIGYLSSYFSKYAQSDKVWKVINIFIISFMSLITIYVLMDIIS